MDIRQQNLERLINCNFDDGFSKMLKDEEKISSLNRELSTHTVVWGDPTRVHVSPRAAVGSTIINVNSGTVEIDDYTFSGSNVSILAGSHDVYLRGFLRRDVEFNEGFDIKIGKGVWLASNSVILGPCQIGDNAVIAAGAVITPGTIVPPNAIYAGVPAKMISTIEFAKEEQELSESNISFMNAIDRNAGIVFVEGISEKKAVVYDNKVFYGGWVNQDKVVAYKNSKTKSLLFYAENSLEYTLRIETEYGQRSIYISEQFKYINIDQENNTALEKIIFSVDNTNVKLFIGYRSEQQE